MGTLMEQTMNLAVNPGRGFQPVPDPLIKFSLHTKSFTGIV